MDNIEITESTKDDGIKYADFEAKKSYEKYMGEAKDILRTVREKQKIGKEDWDGLKTYAQSFDLNEIKEVNKIMTGIDSFLDKASKDWDEVFIKLVEGEWYDCGVLKDAVEEEANFRGKKNNGLKYLFDKDGKTYSFWSGSISLAQRLKTLIGKRIKIIRMGSGFDTKYDVEVVA